MISIIINSFNEPGTIGKAIESFVKQKIKEKYEILVICPDKKTIEVIKQYQKKHPQIKHIKDEGKGKSLAINKTLPVTKGRIIILSDGDVFVGSNSVNSLLNLFKDKKMGCVSGRPVPQENKNEKYGYWSHLLFYGAHKIRKKLFNEGKFLECSGYLFAFRNNIIKEFPLDVAEDAIIPYMFYLKNYKIGYAEKALVYVKNPNNFKDWLKQRKRTAKAHETLTKYYPNFPRVKSFWNEVKYGFFWALSYPQTIREMYWTILLFFARTYMWLLTLTESKLLKRDYMDAWERVHSTK
jgi:cellulose synthase/poly-beta-1,6-N-acetylglucosamine synthase-like glycosyltransferase